MSLALSRQTVPLWGRRPEGPVGGVVGRRITPPTIACGDTSPTGGGF
jgi:hypothetical protein